MKAALTYLLVLAPVLTGCADGRTAVPTSTRPSLSVLSGSAQQEELIGWHVAGAPNTVFHATGPHINAWFKGSQAKHLWGVFLYESLSDCSTNFVEQHLQDSAAAANGGPYPTYNEEHCGYTGAYDDIVITGAGYRWTRSIAMLGARGVLGVVSGNNADADVLVPLDVNTPTSTVPTGSLRGSTTYHAASGDTLQFSTSGATLATGDSVWFISTYHVLRADGTVQYDRDAVLDSYIFDYSRSPGTAQPGVNSSPLLVDHDLPFLHVFRSPGGTTTYTVRVRVVEPFHTSMSAGYLTGNSLVYHVTADPACWTSPGGPAGTSVSFSAACSDQRNAGIAQYRWVWSSGDSSSWSTNTTAYHVYSDSGSKTVTLLIKLSTNEGDTASATHTVSISAPQFTVSITPPVTPVHDTVTVKPYQTCLLRASTSGYSGTYTFTWEKKTKFAWSSIGSGARLNLSVGGTAKYSVRVNASLSGTTFTQSDTLGFNVTSGGALCP